MPSLVKISDSKKGFSLVEILITLALIGTVVSLSGGFLQKRIENSEIRSFKESLEKAFVFTCQNAFLKNAPTRLNFTFTPEQKLELEMMNEVSFGLYKEPSPLTDFQSLIPKVPSSLKFLGVISSYDQLLVTEGSAYLYCLPSGQKDRGLLIFSYKKKRIMALDLRPSLGKSEYIYSEDRGEADDDLFKIIYELWSKKP